MTGRLSKLRRRRDATKAFGSSESSGPALAHDQPTVVAPPAPLFTAPVGQPEPVTSAALPADVLPEAPTGPSFRERGRFRRRLRYLRRVRELGFRDLGGLVFDLHRFARTGDALVRAKLVALDAVDRELRALERVLQDERAFTDLREPGIAACARCGALHGSDAHFCPSCGISLGGPTALTELPVAISAATSPAAAAVQAPPVATPIMPTPEPEVEPELEPTAAVPVKPRPEPTAAVPLRPQPESGPEPAAGPASEAEVAAVPTEARTNPVSAAALGLPVPSPPPVPPLPPVRVPDTTGGRSPGARKSESTNGRS